MNQQPRPESPGLALTWHASKYKVHKSPFVEEKEVKIVCEMPLAFAVPVGFKQVAARQECHVRSFTHAQPAQLVPPFHQGATVPKPLS